MPPAAVASVAEWLDWTAWLQQHGWPAPNVTTIGRDIVHRAASPAGWYGVIIGSRRSLWNGTEVWLGFEPRLAQGRVQLHRLDLEKNLLPLLQPADPLPPPGRVIVLDPGHGGAQPGTRTIAGNRFEKEFTLDWALRLRPLLEQHGWTVRLTRTNDVDISLAERADFANEHAADLFVSLHFNAAFPRTEAAGLETYCLTPQGMTSNVTRDFADDPVRTYPNNAFDADNLRLALRVQRALLVATGATDRGVKRARFPEVLRWQNRPAILVEGGFLSNPAEAKLIGEPAHRQKLAEAVAEALK